MTPSTQWTTWGSEIEVRVTEWAALGEAAAIVRAALERARDVCDLGRGDAEIHAVNQAQGTPVRVSPELGGLIRAALWAARITGGAVSPLAVEDPERTDRSDGAPPIAEAAIAEVVSHAEPDFGDIRIDGDTVFAPFGAYLDLTATAKSVVAHRAARRAADTLECGVCVRVDDVVATWGHCPIGGWQVTLDGLPAAGREEVEVRAHGALATVRAPAGGAESGLDAVTVAADDGLWAYAAAAAALGQGVAALRWLTERDLAARVTYRRGNVRTTDAWLHLPPHDYAA
jgi:thiamine biosynthesis lipoprotein